MDNILKSLLITFMTFFTLTTSGCGGGETDYSLEDLHLLQSIIESNATSGDLGAGTDPNNTAVDVVTPPVIDQNVSTSPNVYPVQGEIITTVGATSASATPITYTLTGVDAHFFSIDEDGNVRFIVVPGFDPAEDANGDNVFEVVVNVADDNQVTAVVVSVTIVFDADRVPPSFTTLPVVQYDEKDTAAIVITAKAGVELASLSYYIESGDDAGLFTLDESTGELRFNNTPDYEYPDDATLNNSYQLTVKVVDDTAYANFTTMDFTIQVGPVNEGVTTTYLASSSLDNLIENSQYTVTFTSEPIVTKDKVTYTVVSGDTNIFSINENILDIATPAVPCNQTIFGCFKETKSFVVTVGRLDEHSNYSEGSITIKVSSK